jgi:hypothetical protein
MSTLSPSSLFKPSIRWTEGNEIRYEYKTKNYYRKDPKRLNPTGNINWTSITLISCKEWEWNHGGLSPIATTPSDHAVWVFPMNPMVEPWRATLCLNLKKVMMNEGRGWLLGNESAGYDHKSWANLNWHEQSSS